MVGHKLRDWELDTILRIRTIEQLTSAKLTLQSLAQLLNEINNIVITEVVGQRIKDALRYVQNSAQELKNGRLKHGFVLSKKAFVVAEAAFSDPSLLALPHFPEDQKWVFKNTETRSYEKHRIVIWILQIRGIHPIIFTCHDTGIVVFKKYLFVLFSKKEDWIDRRWSTVGSQSIIITRSKLTREHQFLFNHNNLKEKKIFCHTIIKHS